MAHVHHENKIQKLNFLWHISIIIIVVHCMVHLYVQLYMHHSYTWDSIITSESVGSFSSSGKDCSVFTSSVGPLVSSSLSLS